MHDRTHDSTLSSPTSPVRTVSPVAPLRTVVAAALIAVTLVATGCSSGPSVRRSPGFGPDNPTPTLAASAVYDYDPGDLQGSDVFRLVGDIMDKWSLNEWVEESAPKLHQKMPDLFSSLGFPLEYDKERAAKLPISLKKYSYVGPEGSPHPFGPFPVFGPGSKADIAKKLGTGRDREGYASFRAVFHSKNDDVDNGVNCDLYVWVVGADGTVIFEGKTRGHSKASPGVHGSKLVERAFDHAIETMRTSVVEEV